MEKSRMEQISLAVVSFNKAKGKFNIPDTISQTEALDLVRSQIRDPLFGAEVITGEQTDILNMADDLGLPQAEYIEYCASLAKEMEK